MNTTNTKFFLQSVNELTDFIDVLLNIKANSL